MDSDNPNKEKRKVDVCYFAGKNSLFEDWEMRYSIRSVCKNFDRLGKLWIIGHMPKFLDESKVEYVWFPDEPSANKDRNLIQKMAWLGAEPQLTGRFIMNSDDHFILKPVDLKDFVPYVEHPNFRYKWTRLWTRRMLRTFGALKERGYTQWNYDTHIPHNIKKSHCRELLKYNFDGNGLCVFTLFFNTLLNDPDPQIINGEARLNARKPCMDLNVSKFVVASNLSMNRPDFTTQMEAIFPDKSPYEL